LSSSIIATAESMDDVEMQDATAPAAAANGVVESAQVGSLPLEASDVPKPGVNVTKPIPYTFDLGHLLVSDANPLPQNPSNEHLSAVARDCAQVLVNQLLTVCPISSADDGLYIQLPDPITPLPREKTVPKAKEPTKWERFAAKKGIKAKKKEGKLVFDEASGEWVPRYGYKGANKQGENDWLVEVDGDKEARTGEAGDARKEKRAVRKERVKRQQRRERANQNRASK